MPKPHVSNALTWRCFDPRSRAIPWTLNWSLVAVGPRSAAWRAAPTVGLACRPAGRGFRRRRTCSRIHLMPKPPASNALTWRCFDPRSRAIPWTLNWSLVAVGPRSAAWRAAPTVGLACRPAGRGFRRRRTCSRIHLMPKPPASNALTWRCFDPRSRAIPWTLNWSLVAVGPRSAARQAAPTYRPGVIGGRTGTSKLTGSTGGLAAGAPF